jgi:hypothetical protein
VHIQVIQNGAILSDDYWNYGWQAGSHSGGTSATVLTDSTASFTTDEWVGYTIINVTDGSRGIITANTSTTITVDELYGGYTTSRFRSTATRVRVSHTGL